MKKKHYGAIDGLRTIACIGIIMMHIAANDNYKIDGFLYQTMIPSFTNFVFLFMIISAFGMCCGYYEKVLNNKLNIADFYKKRFTKVFPFFSILVFLDVMMSPSASALNEAFADLTLLFGFLPSAGNISVIGVGWFLGLIFVFYLCFPFFCFLLENKKRAWVSFGISLIYNFVCATYFKVGRSNIIYSACFFIAGGLIYLYRDEIEKMNRFIVFIAVICSIAFYYIVGGNSIACIVVSSLLLIYAIISRDGILENRFTKFFSSISMEIYLSHMVIFRVIEKFKLNILFGKGWIQYFITVCLVLMGASLFAVVMQYIIKKIEYRMQGLVFTDRSKEKRI